MLAVSYQLCLEGLTNIVRVLPRKVVEGAYCYEHLSGSVIKQRGQ